MKIALAQIKPVTGDLEGNARKIVRDIRRAKKDGADIVIFPETSITGYCAGALFEQEGFVAYNKMFLEKIIASEVPKDMAAIVGFVDIKGKKKNGSMNITNSAAIIQGGKVRAVYDKMLLANGNHHEDKKYFSPGRESAVFEINLKGRKINVGTPICEDIWHHDHERDIVAEMKIKGADMLLVPNYSYFYYGKQGERKRLLSEQSEGKHVPIFYVNAVGIGDIVKNIMIYDGGSMAYDSQGRLVAELGRFTEDYKVIDTESGNQYDCSDASHATEKLAEIYDALVFEQKEMFDVLGIKKAQVHLSGGVDSAVVAAIASKAMGRDNVVLISNPTVDNSTATKGYAKAIADALGIKLYWNSTQEPYESVVSSHTRAFGQEPTLTGKGCIQAVLRTVQGIGAYHTFKSGIVATGNHTEIVLGWSTFHDIGSIGVHAPIGDLTKLEVYALAEYINRINGREIIPKALYDGSFKPAAELADAKDDPIDYYLASGVCAEIIRHSKGPLDLMDDYAGRKLTPEFFAPYPDGRTVYEVYDETEFKKSVFDFYHKSKISVFKSAQGAPNVIISPRSRGFSNRETIINRYTGWYDFTGIKQKLLLEQEAGP